MNIPCTATFGQRGPTHSGASVCPPAGVTVPGPAITAVSWRTAPMSTETRASEHTGKFRPSMFVTPTCNSHGRAREDGTPIDLSSYNYRRAARDAVHFAALMDQWWQNLQRVVGWNVQYFATVEP